MRHELPRHSLHAAAESRRPPGKRAAHPLGGRLSPATRGLALAALVLALVPGLALAQQFTEITPGLPEKANPCVAVGDYDGDGDLDLAMTGLETGSTVPTTRVYRNNGGTFSVVPGNFFGVFAGSIAWGDYDGDGDLDLPVTGITSASAAGVAVTRLYRNDGGTFTSVPHPFPDCYSGAAAWADYDNDGHLDLVIMGAAQSGGMVAGISATDLGFAVWGDYDNDGDLDIMVFGYDAVAQVTRSILYRNDAGTFVDSGSTFHNLFLGTLSWMDYDNDGDLDLLLAGNTSGLDILRIYRNNNATSNAPPSAPSGLNVTPGGDHVVFSWNPSADDHTPPAGLSYNLRVGTTPGGSQIVSVHSDPDGTRQLPVLGNAQSRLTALLGNLVPGITYFWSVQAVDGGFAGSPFAAEGSFTLAVAGVGDAGAATRASLGAAPNPFVASTSVAYVLPAAQPVELGIFDLSGRRVKTLVSGTQGAGRYTIAWDGSDERGQTVPGGVYFARLLGGNTALNRRIVRVRWPRSSVVFCSAAKAPAVCASGGRAIALPPAAPASLYADNRRSKKGR